MLTFRYSDHQPYYNTREQDDAAAVEPVYLSPHFDLKTQQLVDPRHLPELIKEVEFNPRIAEFDKHYLALRLKEQKALKTLNKKELKEALKKIKSFSKNVKVPEHLDSGPLMAFMDRLAQALYLFISREQVQCLNKMGILVEFLSEMLANDVTQARSDLTQTRLLEQEMCGSAPGSKGARPVSAVVASQAQTESASQPTQGQSEDVAGSTKQRPFRQPRSREFFQLMEKNDVLKCLSMLKQNPALAEDCDDERKTPLHVACSLDHTNLVQILVDFGGNLNAKDDFSRRPLDLAQACAFTKKKPLNIAVKELYDQLAEGEVRRDLSKYNHPLYVKYLTPVEQVKELQEFIARVNDMSTLTKKQRDDKAAEIVRQEKEAKRLAAESIGVVVKATSS